MYKSYSDIFDQRGRDYHQAMAQCPQARQQEFEQILALADLQLDQLVCDIPSGGGYLPQWCAQPHRWICVDTSQTFQELIAPSPQIQRCCCETLHQIPIPSTTIDRIISLAGLHHVPERSKFYCEAFRLLKPGGKMAIADVAASSGVAGFLNDFVHHHSRLGHEGDFFCPDEPTKLAAQGFQIRVAQPIAYEWIFASEVEMAHFCQQLFGIDQASIEQILAAIDRFLGYKATSNGCRMNWNLYFLQVQK